MDVGYSVNISIYLRYIEQVNGFTIVTTCLLRWIMSNNLWKQQKIFQHIQ